MTQNESYPPSREVRLTDGVTEGFAEHVALSIYSGGTTELLQGICHIELTIEQRRADAARALVMLLKTKMFNGYLCIAEINEALSEFLEGELLDGNPA